MKYLIISTILLQSCISPDHWTSQQHEEIMQRCRIMCGRNNVKSYSAWDAECRCRVIPPIVAPDE